MKLVLILITTLLWTKPILAQEQDIKIKHLVNLCSNLNETSGLIYYNNDFWTINDSGGSTYIYRFSQQAGHIIQTVKIANARNIDWEDISQDEDYIYVGDTGNNNGARRLFTIYKVTKNDIPKNLSDVTLNAEIIEYSYEDQKDNLRAYAHDFDCEALINCNGQIGILTKNWASGNTSYYIIDEDAKVARKIESFKTFGLITGGDYTSSEDKLILIGYQSIEMQLFPFFISIENFSNKKTRVKKRYQLNELNGYQTEGVCLANKEIFISNEQTHLAPQSLQKIITNN